MISLIFERQEFSMRMKTGAISYVNMLVLAAAVSHSPAMDTMSRPSDNSLKKCGWPAIEEGILRKCLALKIPERLKNAF